MREFLDEMIDKYGLETFEDFSRMCGHLSDIAHWSLKLGIEDNTLDDTAIENLQFLTHLMSIASDLFLECDEYFR